MQGNSEDKAAVRLDNVKKVFGSTKAVDGVSFSIEGGSTHALLGENGAGKSTIVKLLSGLSQPTSGTITIFGRRTRIPTPGQAHALGIQTAFQELSCVPELTVAQNIFLAREPVKAGVMVDGNKMERVVSEVLEDFGLPDVDPKSQLCKLPLPLRQKVEIVKAVARKPRILLLDEPTSTLSGRDVDWVAGVIARMNEQGVTVLFISHRLSEVREFCEYLTILRNGIHAGDFRTNEISDGEVVRRIIGRPLQHVYPPRAEADTPYDKKTILTLNNVSTDKGLSDVSLTLRSNEILGVAALQGMGQSELFFSMFGMSRLTSGHLEIDGRRTRLTSPSDAIRERIGIAYVPEDRKSEGLFLKLSGRFNVSVPIINRFARLGWIDTRREMRSVRTALKSLEVDLRALYQPCSSFSGGNQQKIVIAKWLLAKSRILLLFDPTRGVDVGTKYEIYELMQAFKSAGGTILFYSSEIPELANLCDRLLVLYRGRVTCTLDREALSEDRIMSAVLGSHQEAAERSAS